MNKITTIIKRLIQNLSCAAVLLVIFLVSLSCNTKIDAYIESKPLAIVYCMFEIDPWHKRLEQNYSLKTNYIRLERSFNGGQNAHISGRVPDSIYFKNADVRIQYCLEGNIISTNVLEKSFDFFKEPGIFSTNEYFTYKTTHHIEPQFFDTIRLIIDIPEEDILISSVAPYTPVPKMDEYLSYGGKIDFLTENNFIVSWLDEGCFYEEILRIRYKELISDKIHDRVLYWKKTRSSNKDYNYFDWLEYYNSIYINREYTNSLKKPPAASKLSVVYYPEDFYRYMAMNVKKNDSVRLRKLDYIDIFVHATNKYFREYMNFINFSSDNENIFSNIKNGAGIFATTCSDSVINLELRASSEDFLVNSPYTKHLKFVNYDISKLYTP